MGFGCGAPASPVLAHPGLPFPSPSSGHILLDAALQPQLSNVGLSRLRPPSPRQTSTLTTQSGIHENLGYLPPEFIRHDGKPSCSLDVYSFGMVTVLPWTP